MNAISKIYNPKMSVRETEKAIKFVKDAFERNLVKYLGFERVSAPLFVAAGQGINDDLSGVENAVRFDVPSVGCEAEIVQSLAKWKRVALKKYGFRSGEGIYTDMNAIRPDVRCDSTHSIYVDQWDWEMVISREQRKPSFLKMVASRIVGAIVDTLEETKKRFPIITLNLRRDVTFITSEEAAERYPELSHRERERALAKEYGTVFLMNLGGGKDDLNDRRAPDYDDWSLNGDIIFYDPVLDDGMEISSMGVRVDAESLKKQLELAGELDRLRFEYHRLVAENALPLTIGGGIGQSRLCMLLLEKAHIGEVQVGLWTDATRADCEEKGIHLL